MVAALAAFYRTLFEGCGNAVAATLIQSLRARVHYLRALTTAEHRNEDTARSIRNFKRIVGAARRGDADALAGACTRQVEHAASVAMRILGQMA